MYPHALHDRRFLKRDLCYIYIFLTLSYSPSVHLTTALHDYVRGNLHAFPKNLSHVCLDFFVADALLRVLDHFHELAGWEFTPGFATVFTKFETTRR